MHRALVWYVWLLRYVFMAILSFEPCPLHLQFLLVVCPYVLIYNPSIQPRDCKIKYEQCNKAGIINKYLGLPYISLTTHVFCVSLGWITNSTNLLKNFILKCPW